MKKLAIAIALSMMAMGASAMPTVYGALDVSIDQANEKPANAAKVNKTYVNSNSSFVGVKGDVELNKRLSAVYQIDWTLWADGQNRDFSNRTRYVGLKDKYLGTLKVGQQDTAVKTLSGAVDIFNARMAARLDVESIMLGETRLSNAVVYETPNITLGTGDVKVTGVFTTGEGSTRQVNENGTNVVASRGFGDSLSTSVVYSNDSVLLGVGYDKAIPSLFAPKRAINGGNGSMAAANTVRVVGKAKVQDVTVKGLYQRSTIEDKPGNTIAKSDLNHAQGWLVGAEYTLPMNKAITVKAQYSENVTDFTASNDLKARQIATGVDYAFNKQVKAYGQAAQVTYKDGTSKDKATLVGVGMEYKF